MLKKILIVLSVCVNIFVALPAIVLLVNSEGIQYHIYQNILAPRLGEPKIAFIGDSLTREGFVWAFRIGEINFDVWNYGHAGFSTRQIQHYAKKVAELESVEYAFVMAGINDLDKTIEGAETSFNDYKVILETLMQANIIPVIQFTLYRENEVAPQYIDRLNELLASYANEHQLKTINLNPILCPEKSLLPQYSKDGVHLTQAAYDVWGQKIKDILPALKNGNS